MIILHMTWTPCWFLSVVTEHAVATGHETQSPSSFMLHPATFFSAGGCITFGCMISDSALRLRYSLRDIIIVPCGCETESLRLPLLNGLESDLLARQLTETKFTARRNALDLLSRAIRALFKAVMGAYWEPNVLIFAFKSFIQMHSSF